MSDTDTRSVAEIMWTSEPCCNVQDNNGHCADDCRIWTSPDGLRWEYGSTLDVDVTPDDMLAWLLEHLWWVTIDFEGEHYEWLVIARKDGRYVLGQERTLHAALEAAVRAVAEAER